MASSGRTCYNRDGSRITDGAYLPCSNDTSHDSFCCGTNHQGVGQANVADDVCESNGLCQNYEAFDGTNEGVKLWWRQGCTDPTWKSPYCLPDTCNSGVWKSQNAPVRQCSDNSWCCGDKTCCSVSTSVFRLAATIGPTATTSSSALRQSELSSAALSSIGVSLSRASSRSTSRTASPTASGSATSTPDSGPKGSSGLSTGAKAGIGVGVAVVVILLGIIAFLLMKLKKRKKEDGKNLAEVPADAAQEKPQSVVYAHQATPIAPVELDGGSRVVEIGEDHATELPNDQQRLELPERGSTVGRGGSA